ncbi:Hypothetical protein CINCED_3A021583 [Cinara cedri]|uniref:Mos1 transposase HTH domain-containing protein n=1 Tax=Cinara cedri TaxID=506608 RepID=A0A5E4MU51_9HEMI|nr:Hypothetical protein CINCED_3A021583 [Cinara cedri]
MMMCESDNESENNSSAHISVFEQRAYIKIETIRGKTVPEIHAALNEVCGTDTVDRSTVQRWHQRFRDGRIIIANNQQTKECYKMVCPYCTTMRGRISVVALLEKYGWERLKHPPYSPDLSPPDFDLFPKLKEPRRGISFSNLDILNEEVSRRIRELNKDDVLCGIQALPKRWESCIDKQGDYIEGL